jgi:hypothetical protein
LLLSVKGNTDNNHIDVVINPRINYQELEDGGAGLFSTSKHGYIASSSTRVHKILLSQFYAAWELLGSGNDCRFHHVFLTTGIYYMFFNNIVNSEAVKAS